jgi:hypothetical protein
MGCSTLLACFHQPLSDSGGKLLQSRRMAEAKAVGLKEQSPLGWFLARRALLFQRDGFRILLANQGGYTQGLG